MEVRHSLTQELMRSVIDINTEEVRYEEGWRISKAGKGLRAKMLGKNIFAKSNKYMYIIADYNNLIRVSMLEKVIKNSMGYQRLQNRFLNAISPP